MLDNSLCSICELGNVKEIVKEKTFKYKGQEHTVENYKVFKCEVCKESIVDKETVKRSIKEKIDFHREVDVLLKPNEIKEIRVKQGFTQEEFSKILKVAKKTFARYENGRVAQSRSMDELLRSINKIPNILLALIRGEDIPQELLGLIERIFITFKEIDFLDIEQEFLKESKKNDLDDGVYGKIYDFKPKPNYIISDLESRVG
ncbi:MAG: type II toxin-antitoxin system MqsA family antitoxin [Desulfobacterales bacterium]|nr:type II toxin-antitoxin system MqsA family antitoxin [Desulfobacterales bacterium]